MRCCTVRTRLMNLMCCFWHGMFIFHLWLIKKLKWFIAAMGVWAVLSCGCLIMIWFLLICVITDSIYCFVESIVMLMKCCISSPALHGYWLTNWELSWNLRFEMRGFMQSANSLLILMWLSIFLLQKYSFCIKWSLSVDCTLCRVTWRQRGEKDVK